MFTVFRVVTGVVLVAAGLWLLVLGDLGAGALLLAIGVVNGVPPLLAWAPWYRPRHRAKRQSDDVDGWPVRAGTRRPETVVLVVATERLGWPGKESGWRERSGFVQKHDRYPTSPDEPTATCHLQPANDKNALCGYPWETLVAVPGHPEWSQLDDWLRCDRCEALRGVE